MTPAKCLLYHVLSATASAGGKHQVVETLFAVDTIKAAATYGKTQADFWAAQHASLYQSITPAHIASAAATATASQHAEESPGPLSCVIEGLHSDVVRHQVLRHIEMLGLL